jgi:hypothetical protein
MGTADWVLDEGRGVGARSASPTLAERRKPSGRSEGNASPLRVTGGLTASRYENLKPVEGGETPDHTSD